jgi:hypothetical protein
VGHVEITRGRQWITVDPGCPVYTGEPERRNWFRGQRAHASVLIDDVELATPGATAFRWQTVAPTPTAEVADRGAHWYCRLAYDYVTPRGTVAHERQVVLVRGHGVIVCDMLAGVGPRAVTVRWPLGARAADVVIDHGDSRASVGDAAIGWMVTTGGGAAAAVEPTRRSPKFGEEVDASALVVSLPAASLPCSIVTSFTPRARGRPVTRVADGGIETTIPPGGCHPARRILFRCGRPPCLSDVLGAPNERRSAIAPAGTADRGGPCD